MSRATESTTARVARGRAGLASTSECAPNSSVSSMCACPGCSKGVPDRIQGGWNTLATPSERLVWTLGASGWPERQSYLVGPWRLPQRWSMSLGGEPHPEGVRLADDGWCDPWPGRHRVPRHAGRLATSTCLPAAACAPSSRPRAASTTSPDVAQPKDASLARVGPRAARLPWMSVDLLKSTESPARFSMIDKEVAEFFRLALRLIRTFELRLRDVAQVARSEAAQCEPRKRDGAARAPRRCPAGGFARHAPVTGVWHSD